MPAFPIFTHKLITRLFCLFTALVLVAGISSLASLPAAAADGPDLIVEELSVSPSEPTVDNQVTVTVRVKNQGTGAAPASYVVCYVDANIITTKLINPLEPGMMATAVFTWTAEPGSHVIKATADSSGTVNETDETNNTATFTLTPLTPDLAIDAITWSPQSPSQGDAVIFTVTIGNHGNGRSNFSTMELFIDSNSRGIQDIPGLNPGETVTRTYPWVSQTGQHELEARVDMDDRNTESAENNNAMTLTYSTQTPDLIIESITHDPAAISLNDSVSINITITNRGSGRANPCYLGYKMNDFLKPLVQIPAIEAGESYSAFVNWLALPGTNELTATIDYNNSLEESNESNNDNGLGLVTLGPDLVITNISWDPETPTSGNMTTISITLKNQGEGTAGSSRLSYVVSPSFSDYQSMSPLTAGEQTTISFVWQATPGVEKITAIADAGSQVAETAEENNSFSDYIDTLGPDLIVETITWSPENPAHGETVSFNVTVSNLGPGQAELHHVGYYIDGELLYNAIISPLDSGESITKSYSWKSEQGYHNFKAMADFKKAVMEENETNNEYTVAVVAHMPDLVIEAVSWSPSDIPAGEECIFDITIRNAGTLPAPLTRLAYYVDGTLAGYVDMPALAADAITSQSLVWPATAGFHRIEFITDSTDLVEEIDEGNNTRVVTLPLPDIVLSDVSWTPEDSTVGDTVIFRLTLENKGGTDTQATAIDCIIDGELVERMDLAPITPDEKVNKTFEWTATGGSHTFSFVADEANMTIEADETNNGEIIQFGTLTPNLTISSIDWRMDNPLINDTVEITVRLENTGTDTAPPSQVSYKLDKDTPVNVDIPEILAGAKYELVLTLQLEPGGHDIAFSADASEELFELNEFDNYKNLTFNMKAPDLVVRSISWTPQEAKPGDIVTIAVHIENRGIATAVQPGLSLSIDGTTVQNISLGSINTGTTIIHEFEWIMEDGLHEFNVLADYGGLITETDETNNTGARSIRYQEPEGRVAAVPALGTTVESSFLDENWWMILGAAGIICLTVFFSLLRSFRKE